MNKSKRKLSDRLANSWLGMLSKYLVSWVEFRTMFYYKKFASGRLVMGMLRSVWEHEPGIVRLSPHEGWMIYSLAHAWRNHGGDFAEVGTFRGASAEIICRAKDPLTHFFIFDRFEQGLPQPGEYDPRFEEGMFSSSESVVRNRLKAFISWHIFPGTFPKTADVVRDRRFSFVHLDVDLEDVTFAGLEFFWERLLSGGVIVSHDFSQCEGVARAFKRFFDGRTDARMVELSVTQIMVIKS